MRSEKLSASSINTYNKCPHMYFMKYHTNKKPTMLKEDFHLHFGSIIHKALEIYRNLVDAGKNVSLFKCLHKADEEYKQYSLDNSEFEDAQKMLDNWLNTREIEYPLVNTEEYFVVNIRDFKIHGYIDVIEKIDSNHYRVIDYKTGKTYKNKHEAMESTQLKMYALAVMDLYEVENVEVAFDQLRFESPEFIQYTTDQLRKFVQYLYHIQRTIKNDREHHPRIDWHCRWCDYSNHCEFIDEIDSVSEIEEALIKGDFSNLVALYNEYLEKSKRAKSLADEFKKLITEEMKEKNIEEYESQTFSLTKSYRKLKRVDYSQVLEYVPPEVADEVFQVKLSKLKELVNMDEIDYRIEHSSPYLRVTQKKQIKGEEE